jgi:hypothetical protein
MGATKSKVLEAAYNNTSDTSRILLHTLRRKVKLYSHDCHMLHSFVDEVRLLLLMYEIFIFEELVCQRK